MKLKASLHERRQRIVMHTDMYMRRGQSISLFMVEKKQSLLLERLCVTGFGASSVTDHGWGDRVKPTVTMGWLAVMVKSCLGFC